jgi:beta-phosphoglucomutase-like phosphatase (HAD superfamily)
MFKRFIFDIEGTLLNSVSQKQVSLRDAVEKSGYRVPIQTLRLYSAWTAIRPCSSWPDASDRERIAILEHRRGIYERDYLPRVKPLEGAREVISILAEQGGRIALATDCRSLSFTRHMLLLDSRDYISPQQPAATTSSTASRTPARDAAVQGFNETRPPIICSHCLGTLRRYVAFSAPTHFISGESCEDPGRL